MKWIFSQEMNSATQVQDLDKAVYISHSSKNIGQVWLQIFSFLMGKIVGQTEHFNLDMQPV